MVVSLCGKVQSIRFRKIQPRTGALQYRVIERFLITPQGESVGIWAFPCRLELKRQVDNALDFIDAMFRLTRRFR